MKRQRLKMLALLQEDARISTKALGAKLKVSQQAASYLLTSLREKSEVQEFVLKADPAKFGLVLLSVVYSYTNFESKATREIKDAFVRNPSTILVEELASGGDLFVTFATHNLSQFNKINQQFLEQFRDRLELFEILVHVVRHDFGRAYLEKRIRSIDAIFSGDRDPVQLTSTQMRVLHELVRNPRISLTLLSERTKIHSKSCVSIKKFLEKKRVIKGYSILPNFEVIGVSRAYAFLRLHQKSAEDISRFVVACMQNRYVVELTKIIGSHDMFLLVEGEDVNEVLLSLRKDFPSLRYSLIRSRKVLKQVYLPEALFENGDGEI